MKKIDLFDHELIVKDSLCSTDPKSTITASPSLRLYIKLTDACNADCLFCANKDNKDFGLLDLHKLEYVINYLIEKNILHGISITGGEPMTNPEKLNELINLIYQIDSNIEVAISTNGYNLLEFSKFDNINKLESIHISRHHYSDDINKEIFRSSNIANTSEIISLQEELDDKKIININTLIMRNYIENLKEIKNMLNYIGELGIYKNGFVSLMKCNQFSKKHFINFNEIFNTLDDNFYLGHHFYSEDYCECVDGVYFTNTNKLVEFYARMVKNCNCPYTTQLVYTSDNRLTKGFGKSLLFK